MSATLIRAAEKGCARCCARYIEQAGRIVEDCTALSAAAEKGNVEIVQLLIPREAGMQNKYGTTALMEAAFNGHFEVVELLAPQEAGAQTISGWTALMMAVWSGNPKIIRSLIPREGGMKNDDGQTALEHAIKQYQLQCLSQLLESEAELKASNIPPVMLAAYRGDIGGLLQHRDEWKARFLSLTVLDFALLGRQRRAIRLLTRQRELWEFFARWTIPKIVDADEELANNENTDNDIDIEKIPEFIACHGPLVCEFIPVICAAKSDRRSDLFALSLVYHPNTLRYIRPFRTPDPYQLNWCLRESHLAYPVSVVSGLKNAGFSCYGKTIVDFIAKHRSATLQHLETDSLKRKQIQLAEKEAQTHVSTCQQVAWREVEPESSFNRRLLLEARGIAWGTLPPPKLVHDKETSHIKEKRQICKELLLQQLRIMFSAVSAMLDE